MPLTFDLSLEQLRIYRGKNPRPADFDSFWDSSLQEYFRHSDPMYKNDAPIFERLRYIDIQFLAPRVQAEVLWGIGLMDTICPPSSQFAVYNKLTSSKMVIYPDFGHESIQGWNNQAFQFLMGV